MALNIQAALPHNRTIPRVAEQVEILDIQRANPVKNPAVVSDSYFASDTSGSSILDVTSDRLTDDSSDDTFS